MKRLKVEITVLSEEFTDEEVDLYKIMIGEVNENIRQTLLEEVFEGQDVTVKSEIVEEASQ